jgi:hypothetical protein
MDMLMMIIKSKQWRLAASFFCLISPLSFAQSTAPAVTETAVPSQQVTAPTLQPFSAVYEVFRSGEKHGSAERYLKKTENGYELGYHSDINWLIFDDEREERSLFTVENGQIRSNHYLMKRAGSGPNRHYELNLDRLQKTLKVGKKQKLQKIDWNDNWLDSLSYHSQIVLDLQAGKTDFVYQVLNRDGNPREYKYKVTTEELLSLPFGKVKALRIERYGQSPDKQVYAWVAPELDYMLVRLWQSEDNVEQFDVQLSSIAK